MIRTVRILTDHIARRLAQDDNDHGVVDRLRFQLRLHLGRLVRPHRRRSHMPGFLRPQSV